ncbi:MAG: SDR family NAD(P)-dependent oxidoreductase, partial [Pseudomonadota bacterium]
MADTWIILGASSAMGRAFARQAAGEGCHVILCARDAADLDALVTDTDLRSADGAQGAVFDVRDPATFAPIYEAAKDRPGTINAAVFVGSMPAQGAIDTDPAL